MYVGALTHVCMCAFDGKCRNASQIYRYFWMIMNDNSGDFHGDFVSNNLSIKKLFFINYQIRWFLKGVHPIQKKIEDKNQISLHRLNSCQMLWTLPFRPLNALIDEWASLMTFHLSKKFRSKIHHHHNHTLEIELVYLSFPFIQKNKKNKQNSV